MRTGVPPTPSFFGDHVKRLREVRGLTQDELADRSGLAGDTIRRLEHEEFSPSLRTLQGLVAGLEISLTALFSGYELIGAECAREFSDLLATRSQAEQRAFTRLWRQLAKELDAPTEPGPDVTVTGDKPTKDPFGRHLRSLRRARGLTQEVLAEYSGLATDTVRRLEHGSFSPSLATLRKVGRGLDLGLSTLFESFETGERNVDRELADLLHLRPPAERDIALRVIRFVFETLDELRERQPSGSEPP